MSELKSHLLDNSPMSVQSGGSSREAYASYQKDGGALRSRFLNRSGPFHQSGGQWNIKRKLADTSTRTWYVQAYARDWFHTLVNKPTWHTVGYFVLAFYLSFVGYALIYYALGKSCNLDTTNFTKAFMFSFETMMTIGYSTRDIFFDECISVGIVISSQSILLIFLDALTVGIMLARFSRAKLRAETVTFSDKAVIRQIRGHFYLMFQVVEMRKHQLVDAHVRCYGMLSNHGAPNTEFGNSPYQCHRMRLLYPDDELGGSLLLVLPVVIVHRIDPWSPLYPLCLKRMQKRDTFQSHDSSARYLFPDIRLRSSAAEYGNHHSSEGYCTVCGQDFRSRDTLLQHCLYEGRQDIVSGSDAKTSCRICGEAFVSEANLALHSRKHTDVELQEIKTIPLSTSRGDGSFQDQITMPSTGESHAALWARLQNDPVFHKKGSFQFGNEEEAKQGLPYERKLEDFNRHDSRNHLQTWLADSNAEVVCLVEGADDMLSGSVQARHSYNYNCGDIVFDSTFAPCVRKMEDGNCLVDFDKFHDLIPVGDDVEEIENWLSYQ